MIIAKNVIKVFITMNYVQKNVKYVDYVSNVKNVKKSVDYVVIVATAKESTISSTVLAIDIITCAI